ncbi:hypothetical protein EES47_17390 [Streptomyces sp. ADI98-12]|uniref:DUF3592 domain-containing protein n=1 Tax=Streptomyces rutgersensis TaxID=53451 RepID=A0ABX6RTF7_9ACTN|nr:MULTISPECIES: DUF3592 domain-containing protein [Streptomyces]QNE83927.1 hypothetical protein F0345_24805 [Streptomyces rutgersensis]RPK87401.1 hypothetical protein EES47_17390 [Streptomyces sp. ADI98-12]
MADKNQRKKRRDDYTPPPRSRSDLAREREWERERQRAALPPLPQRRLIATVLAIAALCGGGFLFFLLPSQERVADLREHGVLVLAEVTSVTTNKYGEVGNVGVRFSGPGGQVETELVEWGGKLPDGLRQGAQVPVTYAPEDPNLVMTTAWVQDPPGMTLPMIIALLLAPLALLAGVLMTVRRRKLLKEYARLAPA